MFILFNELSLRLYYVSDMSRDLTSFLFWVLMSDNFNKWFEYRQYNYLNIVIKYILWTIYSVNLLDLRFIIEFSESSIMGKYRKQSFVVFVKAVLNPAGKTASKFFLFYVSFFFFNIIVTEYIRLYIEEFNWTVLLICITNTYCLCYCSAK